MNARLAALADALALITVGDPLLPIEIDACREAAVIVRALAEQGPVAWRYRDREIENRRWSVIENPAWPEMFTNRQRWEFEPLYTLTLPKAAE